MDSGITPGHEEALNSSAAVPGDVTGVASSLSSLCLGTAAQEPSAQATTGTPQFSLPAKPMTDEVKKQLFPIAVPCGADDSSTGGLPSDTQISPANTLQQQQQQHEETSSSSTVSDQGNGGPRTDMESPRDLKIVVDSASKVAAAAKDIADPASTSSIGMSPGARSFAPPFGAKFGDRCNPKAGAGRKGMELVHEEDDSTDLLGEPSPDGPPLAAGAVGSSSPAAPSSPSLATNPTEETAHTTPTDAAQSSALSEPIHAPRVATSALHASAADASSRPRFRMAFEGRRDQGVVAPTESKFAPTPRVKPKDGLPWGR